MSGRAWQQQLAMLVQQTLVNSMTMAQQTMAASHLSEQQPKVGVVKSISKENCFQKLFPNIVLELSIYL